MGVGLGGIWCCCRRQNVTARDGETVKEREIEWLQISGEKRNNQRRRMIPFFTERGFIAGVVPSHYVHLSSVSAHKDTV